MTEDFEHRYRAVCSRDPRFDGWFVTAVTSTGIYCRPSCPAVTPGRGNVRFFATAAAAQHAGFRACRRCRPDATPGSPEWDLRADLVGRAMRLIADGVVDREGVTGLAARLGYTSRHVHRQLVAEVGAGPRALARAQRAQTARTLIETTTIPFARIAFAAGFASVRQFNATVAEVFAASPTQLRRRAGRAVPAAADTVTLRLPHRAPGDVADTLAYLGERALPGCEEMVGGSYRRSLHLPHGDGVAELSSGPGHVRCRLRLDDLRDLAAAVQRCRRLLDTDADPVAVDAHLAADPLLAPLVAAAPGRRVARAVDGTEIAVRAVLGQQVSLAAARTLGARLVATYGKPLTASHGGVDRLFPDAGTLAGADLTRLGAPAGRQATLSALAGRIADGRLCLDPGADRPATVAALRSIPGVGPWTAEYVAMRALGDPDAFPAADAGLRRAFARLPDAPDSRTLARAAERWRPWRAYAARHLWATLNARRPR